MQYRSMSKVCMINVNALFEMTIVRHNQGLTSAGQIWYAKKQAVTTVTFDASNYDTLWLSYLRL